MIFEVKSWCSPETKLLPALVTPVILSFSTRCNGINTTFSRMFYHLERQAWAGKDGVFILKTKCVQGRSQQEAGEAGASSDICQIFLFFVLVYVGSVDSVASTVSPRVCLFVVFYVCLPPCMVSTSPSLNKSILEARGEALSRVLFWLPLNCRELQGYILNGFWLG